MKHAAVLASISAVHERQNSPIRERQPALAERVVLMSGEEPDEALRAFLDERGSRFLGKPFHSSELYAVVQAAAGDAPANGEA